MPRRSAAVLAVLAALAVIAEAQRGRKVTGVVTAAATQRPVVGAQVEYEDQDADDVAATTTDGKGAFELPAGRLGTVTVTARGYATAYRTWPPRVGRTLRVVLLPPARVVGHVIDMVTRRAVPAGVALTVRSDRSVVSDAALAEHGRFVFEDLPTGPAVIEAWAEGYAPTLRPITVRDKEDNDQLIRLRLQGVVRGLVVNDAGDPLAGAEVRVWYSRDFEWGGALAGRIGGRLLTGPDGVFMADGLVPDTPVHLQAVFEGAESGIVTVTLAPGRVQEGITFSFQEAR